MHRKHAELLLKRNNISYSDFHQLLCILHIIHTNVSSVVEFQVWWVLRSNFFGQESTYSKEFSLKKSVDELLFIKKCQNCTFKVNFWYQKSTKVFQKEKIILRTSTFKRPFFSIIFFLNSIFDKLTFLVGSLKKSFPWWFVDFWPKMMLIRTHYL